MDETTYFTADEAVKEKFADSKVKAMKVAAHDLTAWNYKPIPTPAPTNSDPAPEPGPTPAPVSAPAPQLSTAPRSLFNRRQALLEKQNKFN
jgi:hypothetical protein